MLLNIGALCQALIELYNWVAGNNKGSGGGLGCIKWPFLEQ